MAKEWYLMKSPYDQLSGYESEAMDDFAQEGFLETLDSEVATDVKLYNYDLSVCQDIRAVVQNNTQDTKLKTLSRAMLVPIGTCVAGMYVHYNGRYWLIVSVVDNNKMYEKAILSLCNYLLTWQNSDGQVFQRWANVINASQYNNGEQMVKHYTVRSDQLLVSISDDDDALMINSGIRFILDKRCEVYERGFSKDITQDTSNPVMTYEVTRVNNVVYDYIEGGYLELMVDQDEQHEGDGYYVIDQKGYWLCEQKFSARKNDEHAHVSEANIVADSYEILNGIEPSVFLAKFYDAEGHETEAEFSWNIDCDFADDLDVSYQDNAIYIYVDNNKLLNKSFTLLLSADGYETVSAQITIRAFI